MKFIETNKLMDNSLKELAVFLASKQTKAKIDVSSLAKFTQARVVVHQGCYLLDYPPSKREFMPDDIFVPTEHMADRTTYECYYNHVHAEDILHSQSSRLQLLTIGISMMEILQNKLAAVYPNIHFRIIITSSVLPNPSVVESSEERNESCIVRFHHVRNGENFYENIDFFKYDAAGITEI